MVRNVAVSGDNAKGRFARPPWTTKSGAWRQIDARLPEDHLARRIDQAVNLLDLSPLYASYLGVGKAFFSSDFKEDPWWGLGYSSEEQWLAAGSPSTSNDGYTRQIEVDDSDGLVVVVGCAVRVAEGVSVDLYWRKIDAGTAAVYTRTREGIGSETFTGSFPMDSTGLGFGVRYSF